MFTEGKRTPCAFAFIPLDADPRAVIFTSTADTRSLEQSRAERVLVKSVNQFGCYSSAAVCNGVSGIQGELGRVRYPWKDSILNQAQFVVLSS